MVAALKLSRTALLYAAAFSLIIAMGLFTVYPRDVSSHSTYDTDMGELNSHCSKPLLKVKDVINMAKFTTLCRANRLTELPPKLSPTADQIANGLSSMVMRPIASACNCPRKLRLVDFPSPVTGLITFPGSGTTWMRHLIQQLTGIYTGTVYPQVPAKRLAEFPYAGKVDKVLVIATHRPPEWDGSFLKIVSRKLTYKIRFERLLILLRSPYEASVAEFKRGNLHLGKVGNAFINITDTKWISTMKKKGNSWKKFIRAAFNTSLPVFVMYYEDLKSCFLPELIRLATFLSSEYMHEFSFCCALRERKGSYQRPPSKQTVEDIYTSKDRIFMNEVIKKTVLELKNLPQADSKVAQRLLGYLMSP